MILIRPIQVTDFDALVDIAKASGHGFTSLPVDEALLKNRIKSSIQAFNLDINTQPNLHFNHTPAHYLFVAEDTDTKLIVGTSAIDAAVGLSDPFYHYRLSKIVHSSHALNVYKVVELLTLCNDYTGATEIGSLFLMPEYRQGLNGKLLSKFRFLFMAEHRNRFSDRIFAEMRGICDEDGHSPFWRWLQDNFFQIDFPTADYLSGIGNKAFIAELMPQLPIYVNLLSKKAQAVMGKVHEQTLPALKLLQHEGFSYRGYIDIFDAGPTVEAELNHIRSVSSSLKLAVEITDQQDDLSQAELCLLVNTQVKNFRATLHSVVIDKAAGKVYLPSKLASYLKLTEKDSCRILLL